MTGWILRHDWITKRAIPDDSILPALEYLSANYTGDPDVNRVGVVGGHKNVTVDAGQ